MCIDQKCRYIRSYLIRSFIRSHREIILAVLFAITIVLAAAFAYFYWNETPTEKPTNSNVSPPKVV